jgi:hypothetical protein
MASPDRSKHEVSGAIIRYVNGPMSPRESSSAATSVATEVGGD